MDGAPTLPVGISGGRLQSRDGKVNLQVGAHLAGLLPLASTVGLDLLADGPVSHGLLRGSGAAMVWPRGFDPSLQAVGATPLRKTLREREAPASLDLFSEYHPRRTGGPPVVDAGAPIVEPVTVLGVAIEQALEDHADAIRGLRRSATQLSSSGVRRTGAAASGTGVKSEYVSGSMSGKPFLASNAQREQSRQAARAASLTSSAGAPVSREASDVTLFPPGSHLATEAVGIPGIAGSMTEEDIGSVGPPGTADSPIESEMVPETSGDLGVLAAVESFPGGSAVSRYLQGLLACSEFDLHIRLASPGRRAPVVVSKSATISRSSETDLLAFGVNPSGLLERAASASPSSAAVSTAAHAASQEEAQREEQDSLLAARIRRRRAREALSSSSSSSLWTAPPTASSTPPTLQEQVSALGEAEDEMIKVAGWQKRRTAEGSDMASLWSAKQPIVVDYEESSSTGAASTTSVLAGQRSGDFEAEVEAALQVKTTLAKTTTGSEWAITTRMSEAQLSQAEAKRVPALTYPFRLDLFQREAVCHIENGRSVFVAAHTSAGKTVVAEYAIAVCARNCTRCVYTSPIKALSNQKYRDFKTKFGDVGLVTGDVSVDPDASCLVMTTEILRSMLYRGADLVRDIEWVIFDEVHYVNDAERGVVWEETIILLPDHVGMVFLSATTPNTVEFCEWIGRTKRRPVHVVTTLYRPVPLSHSLWAKNKSFLLLGPDHPFDSSARDGAAAALTAKTTRSSGSRPSRYWSAGDKDQWSSLVRWISSKELSPAVVFLFSKNQCISAASMLSGMDLLTGAEKSRVRGFMASAALRLQGSDRRLPQLLWLTELLLRGFGVHHGGLLPILKECVEMLFSEGLVKILFATETFAMGVNMPARTVVFGSIRKHDGTGFRELLPGEYTQMAGRAGRRGIDDVGTVLIACFGDEPAPSETLRAMLTGLPSMLSSRFRLTYPMLLSLLRVEDLSVSDMMRQSYSEFAAQRAITGGDLPGLLARGTAKLRELDAQAAKEGCIRGGDRVVDEYFRAVTAATAAERTVVSAMLQDPSLRVLALTPGRVITVSETDMDVLPATVLAVEESTSDWALIVMQAMPVGWVGVETTPATESAPAPGGMFDLGFGSSASSAQPKPGKLSAGWEGKVGSRWFRIRRLAEDQVLRAFGVIVKPLRVSAFLSTASGDSADPDSMVESRRSRKGGRSRGGGGRSEDPKTALAEAASAFLDVLSDAESKLGAASGEYQQGIGTALPPFDPVRDLEDASSLELLQAAKTASARWGFASSSKCAGCPALERQWTLAAKRSKLAKQLALMRRKLSDASLTLFPELRSMSAVLERLAYVRRQEVSDEPDALQDLVVELKGRVACEVQSGHALVVTELMFEGVLAPLEPEEAVAVLSALVCQEKVADASLARRPPKTLPLRVLEGCDRMVHIASTIALAQSACGLDTNADAFCEEYLNFSLVEVVLEWARGTPFAAITGILPGVHEGSIVRTITRLDNLCREVKAGARVIGDPQLFRKIECASAAIKRDIVFAASLYVT
jgi:antiviral helicase SKI2